VSEKFKGVENIKKFIKMHCQKKFILFFYFEDALLVVSTWYLQKKRKFSIFYILCTVKNVCKKHIAQNIRNSQFYSWSSDFFSIDRQYKYFTAFSPPEVLLTNYD